jgi:hypothetical protein
MSQPGHICLRYTSEAILRQRLRQLGQTNVCGQYLGF